MIIILIACALLLLLFFQRAKSPPACGTPGSCPEISTRKKGPQKAAKFKLIKVLKQRKIDDVRRGFGVRVYRTGAGILRTGTASGRFHKVKRETDANPGYGGMARTYIL